MFIFLLLLSLFNLTTARHQLADGPNQLPYSSVNQCFGGIGQSAEGSHRLYFKLTGVGHCQLFLCYPGQLDPNRIKDGKMPDMAFAVANMPGNMVADYCQKHKVLSPASSDQWHGIYLQADPSTGLSIGLSISNETFHIPSNIPEFQLVLGTAEDLYAKIQFHAESGNKIVHNKDNELRQQFVEAQYNGSLLKDFVGFWTLALDILPSNPWENQLDIYKESTKVRSEWKVCDPRRGEWKNDNCHIGAWFLQPGEPHISSGNGTNGTADEPIELPKSWQMKEPLRNGGSVLIRGRTGEESSESLEIHLLHNWTEPDYIMAETILFIKVRRKYLNIQSRINATKADYENLYDKSVIPDEKVLKDRSEFSLKIAITGGIYKVELNCALYELDTNIPLNSTANVDHIFIGGKMELLGEPIITSGEKVANDIEKMPISYSVDKILNAHDFLHIRGKFAGEFVVNQSNLLEINLIQYDHHAGKHANKRPDTAATILVHFLAHARLQADNETILFDYFVIGPNPKTVLEGSNLKVKSAEEFHLIFTPSNAVYLNNKEVVGPRGHVDMGAINYVQFKGNFSMSLLDISHILKSPFKPFSDLLLYTSGPYFELTLSCQNASKCPKKNEAFKMRHLNGKLDLIGKGRGESFDIEFATEQYYEVRVHANLHDYQIYVNGSFIGNADYHQFTPPEHIDTIHGALRQPYIEWDKQQDANELAIPFFYMLPKSLEIGSRIKFRMVPFARPKYYIYLAHSIPFYRNGYLGQLVVLIEIDFSNNLVIKAFIHGVVMISNKILNFTNDPEQECEIQIIVQSESFQLSFNGEEGSNINMDELSLPVWAVDYVSMEVAEEMEKKERKLLGANITWPSDMTEKWLEPSEGVSLRPPNSLQVFGFTRIELSAKLVGKDAKEIAIYFLNNCQEWSEKVAKFCDVVLKLKIEIVPDGENFNLTSADNGASFSHKNNQWSPIETTANTGRDQQFKEEIKKDFKLTINAIQDQFESIGLNFSANEWRIQKSYENNLPFRDITYIHAAGDFVHIEVSEIIFSENPPFFKHPTTLKVGRPLRVSDSIQFKLRKMTEGTIKFVCGTSNPDLPHVGKTILTIEIKSEKVLFHVIRNKPSKTFELNSKLGLSFEVQILDGQNYAIRNSAGGEELTKFPHYHVFWAIQYIHVHPSLEMEDGYPKIVHNY